MGKRAGRMFLKGFLISFIIIAFLFGAGVLGYQLTMKNLQVPGEEAITAYQDKTVKDSSMSATVDEISKNLIYCYNEDTEEITRIVLEIFDSQGKRLTYITIPMRTQLMMSDSLYREMVLISPEFPQVLLLSTMTKYLDIDTAFDYGVLMIEDLLGIDVSYYTAIPQSTYDTIFTGKIPAAEGNLSSGDDVAPDGQTLPIETFTEDYTEFLKTIKTEEDISAYIESVYPDLKSNLSVNDKLHYLEDYLATPLSNISFELIKGVNQNSAFLIDKEQVSERLRELSADTQTN